MNFRSARRPGYSFYLSALLLIAGTFLGPDLMRRYLDYFEGHSAFTVLANAGVVALFTALLGAAVAGLECALEATATRAAERVGLRGYRADLTLFLLFYTFYSALVHFGKQLAIGPFEALGLDARIRLSWGVALLGVALYPLLRRAILRLVEATEDSAPEFLQRVACLLALALLAVPAEALLVREARAVPEDSRRPDIFLISVDALAARDMSLYGYPRRTTPNLDRLAREGYAFEEFHATSNTTSTSLRGLQGYYPGPLPGPALTTVLQENGYTTEFVSFWGASFMGIPSIPRSTLIRAFEGTPLYRALNRVLPRRQLIWLAALGTEEPLYFNPYDARVEDEYHRFRHRDHTPARLVFDYVLGRLGERPGGRMFWVHLWEPHYPYLPPPDLRGTFGGGTLPEVRPLTNAIYAPWVQPRVDEARNLYDEYILSADREIGRFLEELRERGRYDGAILAVTSDHGESFEGGYVGHGGYLASEILLRIPLILRLPSGSGPAPSRPRTFSDLVDVAPTLLDFLGIGKPRSMPGESLVPYLTDPERLSRRPRWAASYQVFTFGRGQIAVYWKRYKLVYWQEDPNRRQLFDLFADPGETRDLAADHPDLVEQMMQVVRF